MRDGLKNWSMVPERRFLGARNECWRLRVKEMLAYVNYGHVMAVPFISIIRKKIDI